MLKIRLARVGKKKKPSYRFVVSDSQRDLYGKATEIIGHFNPFTKVVDVKKDRAEYWIGKGAQLSPTVHNLFVDYNVISAAKVKASKSGKKKGEATVEPASAPAEATTETLTAPEPTVETPQ